MTVVVMIDNMSKMVNLVDESIQIGESWTEKAPPSCSWRNLTDVVLILSLTQVEIISLGRYEGPLV